MSRTVLWMFLSLDGYIEGPDKEFIAPEWSSDMDAWTRELQDAGETMIFGRRVWQALAEYWPRAEQNPSTPAELELARFMNGTPKYVFSRTLESADAWSNSTVITEDPVAAFPSLKDSIDGDLYVLGGAALAGTCMQAGLIDEYRLLVVPRLYGGGTGLFPEGRRGEQLKLIENRILDTGAVYLRYIRDQQVR